MKIDDYLLIFVFIFMLKYLLKFMFSKHQVLENMKNVYNYGEPESSESPSSEMIRIFNVKYPKRPSLTGIYTETGPLGANIGCYDSQTQACNCINMCDK